MATASVSVIPTQTQAAEYRTSDLRSGAFVGARLRLAFGKEAAASPRAELAIAPSRNEISGDGSRRTRIGEGLALRLSLDGKPTLTLAGIPADRALGLEDGRDIGSGKTLGVSDGGWVAIGIGVIAVAAGAYAVHLAVEADKNTD